MQIIKNSTTIRVIKKRIIKILRLSFTESESGEIFNWYVNLYGFHLTRVVLNLDEINYKTVLFLELESLDLTYLKVAILTIGHMFFVLDLFLFCSLI